MRPEEVAALVRATAQQYGVDPDWAHRLANQESRFNPAAQSSVGAQGVMQLMPATARDLGVENAFDARSNIDGGVRYMKQLSDRFNGDQVKASAAYNWGMGNVERKGLDKMPLETRDYIKKVAGQDDNPFMDLLPGRGGAVEQNPFADLLPSRSAQQSTMTDAAIVNNSIPEQNKPASAKQSFMQMPAIGIPGATMGNMISMARGVRDIIDGGAQLATRGLEAISPKGSAMERFAQGERKNVEAINADAEQKFRAMRGETGFDGGRLAGNILPSLFTGGASLPGAIASGAGFGALSKVDNPEDSYWSQKGMQTAVGGAFGGVGNVVGRYLGQGINSFLKPSENKTLSAAADRIGYQMSPAEQSGSRAALMAENYLDKSAGSSGVMQARRAANNEKINNAALQAMGAPKVGQVTEDGFSAASDSMRGQAEKIYSNVKTNLAESQPFQATLKNVIAEQAHLDDVANPAITKLANMLSRKTEIDSKIYNALRTKIASEENAAFKAGNSSEGQAFKAMRQSLDEAVDSSLPENLRGAIKTFREQSGAQKTLEKGRAVTSQNVNPASVAANMRTFNKRLYSQGAFPQQMMDIARLSALPKAGNEWSGQLSASFLDNIGASPLRGLATAAYLKRPDEMLNLLTQPMQRGGLGGLLGQMQTQYNE